MKKRLIQTFQTEKGNVQVFELGLADFHALKTFFSKEIEKLDNKALFYPYKDEEIKSILSGGGVFLGGFFKGELIATCAIDFDENYQTSVKQNNSQFPAFPKDEILEFSGLFVAEDFRGQKLSQKMSDILLELHPEVRPHHRLFSVVLDTNIPSMKNFFSKGFKIYGWWQMDEKHKFVYMVNGDSENISTPKLETIKYANLPTALEHGFVVFDVQSGGDFLGAKL